MAEARVTVDGATIPLKPPFLVIGTQNPIDHEGTFPLPEAQLDRFLMRFSLGYPAVEHELKMLEMLEQEHPLSRLSRWSRPRNWSTPQKVVRQVHVDEKIRRYLLEIVTRTRQHEDLALGASPRATIALFRTSQAMAAILGRDFVQPDDVKRVGSQRAEPSLDHSARKSPAEGDFHCVVEEILRGVSVPTPSAEPAWP